MQAPSEDAFIQQGIVQLDLSNWETAIDLFNQALKVNPHSIYAYANRANAYSNLGDYERALDDLNQAIELAPDMFGLYFNRGNTYRFEFKLTANDSAKPSCG